MNTELPELWMPSVSVEPGRTLARVAQGFTAYLADPEFWANEGAHRFFEYFRARIPPEFLPNLATSMSPVWREIAPVDMDGVSETLRHAAVTGRPRHLFYMRLQNDPGAPSVSFSYTEVDPKRASRSAVIEISFPEMSNAPELLAYALELIRMGPVHSLIGGLAFRYDVAHEGPAFHQIYAWASRYVGIDIQKSEEMAWKTPSALPGINWLTYIGPEVAARAEIDLAALCSRKWREGIAVGFVDDGVLVQAGPEPVQGDLNRLVVPEAYVEVANVLGPYFADAPPDFWGPFHSQGHSDLWFRRLLDPAAWAERKIDLDL